jgi:ADP-L-glycero-D-manno-heptose 6-epimerase
MQKGNPKLFKWGEQRRDYAYVKDVVRANLLAADAKESGIVLCGSGKATSFNDLVAILNKTLGTNRVPEYIDNPYGAGYQSYTECDMTLAKEKLGFVPEFDIEKGIKDYYDSGFLVR